MLRNGISAGVAAGLVWPELWAALDGWAGSELVRYRPTLPHPLVG